MLTLKQIKTIGTELPISDTPIRYCTTLDRDSWFGNTDILERRMQVHSVTQNLDEDCVVIESAEYRGNNKYIVPISELIRIGIVEEVKDRLPEYWVVKHDGSQLFKDTVIKYLNNYVKEDFLSGSNVGHYYGIDGSESYGGLATHYELENFKNNPEVLSLEEFIKLSKWNKKPNYVTIERMPGIPVGSLVEWLGDSYKVSDSEHWFTPEEVLDTEFFEKVEERFKVGDYIMWEGNWVAGPYELVTINGNKGVSTKGEHHSLKESYYRLATPEEIEKAKVIEIDGYKFDISKSLVTINSHNYKRKDIESLVEILTEHSGQIKSLNVGCSGQYKVDLPLLKKILDRMN